MRDVDKRISCASGRFAGQGRARRGRLVGAADRSVPLLVMPCVIVSSPVQQVKLAEKPREPSEIEKIGGGLFRKLQDAVNWVPEEK